MTAENRTPGSALQRATGADLELQAELAFHLGQYANHRKFKLGVWPVSTESPTTGPG